MGQTHRQPIMRFPRKKLYSGSLRLANQDGGLVCGHGQHSSFLSCLPGLWLSGFCTSVLKGSKFGSSISRRTACVTERHATAYGIEELNGKASAISASSSLARTTNHSPEP